MLADIAESGDEAIRRYAERLDGWTNAEFRVPADEMRRVASRLPVTFKEDFRYAYDKVTSFPSRQRDSMRAFEVEIDPGIWLGQKLIPVAGQWAMICIKLANATG